MENGAHIKRKKWIESVLAACFWLCVWQVAALLADNSLLFAGPADTAAALCRGIVTAKFWQSIRGSVIRILCGFFAQWRSAACLRRRPSGGGLRSGFCPRL